jgi:hypothetical protein
MYYKCDLGGIPLENLEIGLGWRDYPFLKRGVVPQSLTSLDYRPKTRNSVLCACSQIHPAIFFSKSFHKVTDAYICLL